MATHPLIDLHRHLEGSIRSSTFLDVSRRDGHPLAAEARPRDLLVPGGRWEGCFRTWRRSTTRSTPC